MRNSHPVWTYLTCAKMKETIKRFVDSVIVISGVKLNQLAILFCIFYWGWGKIHVTLQFRALTTLRYKIEWLLEHLQCCISVIAVWFQSIFITLKSYSVPSNPCSQLPATISLLSLFMSLSLLEIPCKWNPTMCSCVVWLLWLSTVCSGLVSVVARIST